MNNLKGHVVHTPAPHKTEGLSVSSINSLTAICELETVWCLLETKTRGQMGIFQSYKWCKNWFENWPRDDQYEPEIITVYDGDKLVSVWPMQKSRSNSICVLSWLGTPVIQYGSPLIDPEQSLHDIFAAVWAFIPSIKNIDMVRLHNVPETSPVHSLLKENCRAAGSTQASILDVGQFADWDAFQANVKKSARRPRRKRYNKLSRAGVLKFTVHKSGRHFADLVSVAIGWKIQWLKKHHWPTTTMAEKSFEKFVSSLGSESSQNLREQNNHWVIGELSIDGNPIAIEIGVVEGDHYYSFLGSYDLAWASFSPGKVQIEAMIGWALEYGIKNFDFLCVEAQYKSDWTDTTVKVDHFAHALSAKGRIYHSVWLKRMRPAAKYALQKLGDNQRDKLLSLVGLGNKDLTAKK